MAAKGIRKNKKKTQITWKEINRQKVLIFWAAVFVIYGFIFCYLPLGGWLMAFQNYKPKDGLLHSQFVGLAKFQQLFSDATFLRVIRNTLAMGIINLVFTFVMAIVFAILLNEVRSRSGKKVVQTISYLPHFISMVIVAGMVREILSTSGPINNLITKLGGEAVTFISLPEWFTTIFVTTGVWQGLGWGTILYLAAMSGINTELYEAAELDGANRFQQCLHVTIPAILPTISTLLVLNIGSLCGSAAFEKVFLLYTPTTYETADIIATYVYRMGLGSGNYSYATAVGLFQGVITLVLLTVANKVSSWLTGSGLW